MKLRWLFVFASFLILGCITPTTTIGYAEKDYPVGAPISLTLKLATKEQCIFGSNPYFIKAENVSACAKLEEDAYYNLNGKVKDYIALKNSMTTLASTILTREAGTMQNVQISTPVVEITSIRKADVNEVEFDKVIWDKKLNISMEMLCGNETEDKKLQYVDPFDGSIQDGTIYLPINVNGSLTVSISRMTYGTIADELKNGSKKTYGNLLIEVTGIPAEYSRSDFENYATIGGQNYNCYPGDAGKAHYECFLNKGAVYSDVNELHLSIINDTFDNFGNVEIRTLCSGELALK